MSDKMREEFEAAVTLAFHQAGNVADLTKVRGQYVEDVHQSAWWAWQASRSAVVIELPQIVGFEGAYDSLQDHELVPRMSDVEDADEIFGLVRSIEVREALEAVGVKCK